MTISIIKNNITKYLLLISSGGWLLYQVRQTSVQLNSVIPKTLPELQGTKAQYIYIDDPRFNGNYFILLIILKSQILMLVHIMFLDIFMIRPTDNLSMILEKPKNLSYILTKWWKTLNRKLAFRLFHITQTGDKMERRRALNTLSSIKHLRGMIIFIIVFFFLIIIV